MTRNKKELHSIVLLVLATAFWGSTFAFTKALTNAYLPIDLITIRFLITALMMFFIFHRSIMTTYVHLKKHVLFYLIILGVLNFFAIYLQTLGLTEIAATNSGFITSLSVLFVPLVEYVFLKKTIMKRTGIAIVVSLVGIYLMSFGFALPTQFVPGDTLTLISAMLYGFFIILVGYLSKQIPSAPLMFTVFLITSVVSFCASLFLSDDFLSPQFFTQFLDPMILFNWGFLIIFGTIISYVFMGLGQKNLDSQTSALIYILEPVFATVIAVFFFGETFFLYKIIGAFLILMSQVGASRGDSRIAPT